jgi:ABC-type phosphate transport system permease subunit
MYGRAACDDAHAVIDTAMAGRLSAVNLAPVGISAAIMATVLMTLISVLLALPPGILLCLHVRLSGLYTVGYVVNEGFC